MEAVHSSKPSTCSPENSSHVQAAGTPWGPLGSQLPTQQPGHEEKLRQSVCLHLTSPRVYYEHGLCINRTHHSQADRAQIPAHGS